MTPPEVPPRRLNQSRLHTEHLSVAHPTVDVYTEVCRFLSLLIEGTAHTQQSQLELREALDKITLENLYLEMATLKFPDSIYDRIIELKEQRLAELATKEPEISTQLGSKAAPPALDQESEPEQGG